MERRLSAIMAADVVGYSTLMAGDESGTLALLKDHRETTFDPAVVQHDGRIVKLMGDGALVEFASVAQAVACALAVQDALEGSAGPIRLRIGISLGDVIVDGGDIYGEGVNLAARLERLAEPGGICISTAVRESLGRQTAAGFGDGGVQEVKGLPTPVRIWRWPSTGMGTPAAGATDERASIAVLPFRNMSADPEQDYFSDGITEDIITGLTRFRSLFVIARDSAFAFRDRPDDAAAIAETLGVRYLVQGSVRRAGQRLRVSARLTEARTDRQLWGERYDRDLEDLFEVQDELTEAIVSALPVRLQLDAAERAGNRPTESLTAYDLLLRGEWQLRHGSVDDRDALDLFERSLAADPGSARTHARIAIWHAYRIIGGAAPPGASIEEARRHVERALELDDRDAAIHAAAASVYLFLTEHALAEAHIERALALNPNDVEVLYRKGIVSVYSGDPAAGVDWLKKAMTLDPLYPDWRLEPLFDAHYMLGAFETATGVFRKWKSPPAHMHAEYAAALAMMGHADAAEAAEVAARMFEERGKDGVPRFVARHLRICRQQAHRDLWLEGYRKAGVTV